MAGIVVRKVKPEKEFRDCPDYVAGQCKNKETLLTVKCKGGLACCFVCDAKEVHGDAELLVKQNCIWKCRTTNIRTVTRR